MQMIDELLRSDSIEVDRLCAGRGRHGRIEHIMKASVAGEDDIATGLHKARHSLELGEGLGSFPSMPPDGTDKCGNPENPKGDSCPQHPRCSQPSEESPAWNPEKRRGRCGAAQMLRAIFCTFKRDSVSVQGDDFCTHSAFYYSFVKICTFVVRSLNGLSRYSQQSAFFIEIPIRTYGKVFKKGRLLGISGVAKNCTLSVRNFAKCRKGGACSKQWR